MFYKVVDRRFTTLYGIITATLTSYFSFARCNRVSDSAMIVTLYRLGIVAELHCIGVITAYPTT